MYFLNFTDVVEQQAVKKTQKRQLTPEQDAEKHIKAGRDKPFLEEMFIDRLKGFFKIISLFNLF